MTDNSTTKGGALIWIKVVTAEFATSHTVNRMDEVGTVEILEPVLVRIMGVGATIEIIGRRILPTFFVTSILRKGQDMCNDELRNTHSVSFLIKHEGSNGPPGVGSIPGLATDTDGGTAPSVLILGSGDRASRHRHG